MKDNINETTEIFEWAKKIVDPSLQGKYDVKKLEILVRVALACIEEDKNARPTMSHVVEMLVDH